MILNKLHVYNRKSDYAKIEFPEGEQGTHLGAPLMGLGCEMIQFHCTLGSGSSAENERQAFWISNVLLCRLVPIQYEGK